MTPQLLLLQARRPDDPAKQEERASFASRLHLPIESVVSHDLLSGPPTLDVVKTYRAVLIGGAGEFDVSKRNLPHFDATQQRLREMVELGYPLFASCFGFQMLVQALGGHVISDPEHAEIGAFELHLTPEAMEDELFSVLPPVFMAQFGHKERAEYLPPGVVNLAYSDRVAYQTFRVPDKPIWATQFHPELTREENLLRFQRYLDIYSRLFTEEEIQQTLANFRPSSETEKLLPRFLELIS